MQNVIILSINETIRISTVIGTFNINEQFIIDFVPDPIHSSNPVFSEFLLVSIKKTTTSLTICLNR